MSITGLKTAVRIHVRLRERLSEQLSRQLPGLLSPTGDDGMSTAEYAIGTVAACAFAALLYKVITSGRVFDMLSEVVSKALHVPF
ncbi:MAG: hypothetical protein QOJ62_2514 [Actinomycetota bacterium]|jgi:hypothetical protein|nr:hypothetical protein [Actinomycetota bacterium]